MKIKLIDLLNMHARNEEMPKKIKFMYIEFQYDDEHGAYYDEDYNMLEERFTLFGKLNNEVEIIEEDKQIEKLGKIYDGFSDSYYDTCLIKIAQKVDEVIDAINKIKEK